MFLLPIKLHRVSFETKGRQNLQKTADFLIESIVFCPLVPPSWISLVDPTSAMYASAIYVSYIYDLNTKPNKFLKPEVPSSNLITASIYFRLEHLNRSRAKGRTTELEFFISYFPILLPRITIKSR